MGDSVREWGKLFLMIHFITLACLSSSVQSVAAASEWPLGLPEEYTTAWINITYRGRNGTLITEKSQFRRNPGRYGKGGKVASMTGVVVHVKSIRNGTINHYGCDPIINNVPQEDWIALIKRGMCDFDVKLENAYVKKAVGMVVYDREDSDSLEDMKLSSYSIPGVFVYKSRGERIANITDSGTRVEMHVAVGEVCSRPYSGINRVGGGHGNNSDGFQCISRNTSVLFVSISFIVLMIISLAWLVFYYVQRFRYLHAKDRLAQRLCNAAKKALAKIPTRSIKQSEKELSVEGECCAVCIEFFKTGDLLRTLPCRHEFHKCCVDPWLLDHRTCPMCKMDILKYYGYIFTGSQESILHLDLEDGAMNSSDSMDSNSQSNDDQLTPHYLADSSSQIIDSTATTPEDTVPRVSITFPTTHPPPGEQSTVRKTSLISLTVVATPNGCVTSVTTAACSPAPLHTTKTTVVSLDNTAADKLKRSHSLKKEAIGPSTISSANDACKSNGTRKVGVHSHSPPLLLSEASEDSISEQLDNSQQQQQQQKISLSSNFETCNSCLSIPRSNSGNTVSSLSVASISSCDDNAGAGDDEDNKSDSSSLKSTTQSLRNDEDLIEAFSENEEENEQQQQHQTSVEMRRVQSFLRGMQGQTDKNNV